MIGAFDMIEGKKMLVVSAHAADYVWRSGGTIAHYIKGGAQVKVICLSLGVRGESNDLWKQPNQTAERVAQIRRGESMRAAELLGITDIDFWELQDYPMTLDDAQQDRMLHVIRSFRPDIILTHDQYDVLNPDHNLVHDFVYRCSIMSNSSGVETEGFGATKQMRLFGFEPHQTELSGFVPGSFVDISDVYEQKVAAMQCFQAQKHLIKYYTDRASLRGNHARRISGDNTIGYAESFSNFFPVVDTEFH